MFNLYNIVTGAQGGAALDNLAQQFGLSRDQADAAVKALIPALSTAFMTKLAHPGGMQEIAGALTDDQHKQAYADPGTAQDPTVQQKGGSVVSSIFGSNAIVQQVVAQASRYTGIPQATIEQMLPVVVSIVLGGVATALHNQNLGGFLGQLAGGLGGLFGQSGVPGQAGTGGFGSLFGNIFGQLAGTNPAGPDPSQTQPGSTQAPPGSAPAGVPPLVQAGIDALGKMFQAGAQTHPAMPADLGAQISDILSGKSR